MADYYQLLGVTPQASAGEIRQAYAKLAREKHPDRFTDPAAKQQAQRAFQDLTTAFHPHACRLRGFQVVEALVDAVSLELLDRVLERRDEV